MRFRPEKEVQLISHGKIKKIIYLSMPKKLTQNEFIERSQVIHNYKYDYSLVKYINNITKIIGNIL